jgi:hypothetical protein
MKQDIEQLIKETLNDHSLPYESGAWEAMAKRLDGTTPSPFYRKWWFAASVGTVLVSSATYFALKQTEKKSVVSNVTLATNEIPQPAVSKSIVPNTNPTRKQIDQNVVSTETEIFTKEIDFTLTDPQTIIDFFEQQHTIGNGEAVGLLPAEINSTFERLILPKSCCLNEELIITNPNDIEFITVISPTGKKTIIAPKETAKIATTELGNIRVQSGDHVDEIMLSASENHLYTDIDPSLLYENGIPTLKFTVSGAENIVHWHSNVVGTENRNEQFIVHPYTERNVSVTVETKDKNGCTISDTRTIRIADDYNLLAPTGFTPLDNDVRTNRFMPYALTERNVGFELVIIDTKNGGILFQTQDATNGWDGIDKRTGEMVPMGSIWAWRVILKNPNIGEKSEYSSTITRM